MKRNSDSEAEMKRDSDSEGEMRRENEVRREREREGQRDKSVEKIEIGQDFERTNLKKKGRYND